MRKKIAFNHPGTWLGPVGLTSSGGGPFYVVLLVVCLLCGPHGIAEDTASNPDPHATDTASHEDPHSGTTHPLKTEAPKSNPDSLYKVLQQPENEADPSWPQHLRWDPMFTAFPDLFAAPEIEIGSLDAYHKQRTAKFDALFELGKQERERGHFDQATKHFVDLIQQRPPEQYRKSALLQLALIAEKKEDWIQAQQIYAHFDSLFPNDVHQPLVYLRWGEVLRRTGGLEQAISKFTTMITLTSKLKGLNEEYLPVIERLVNKAKVEIAESYFMDGDYKEAARQYGRLLVQLHTGSNLAEINRPLVHYKVIYSHYLDEDWPHVEKESKRFLMDYADHSKAIEVRYLLAKSLMVKKRRSEALAQFKLILENKAILEDSEPAAWTRLQVRIGVELAGLMTKEGDLLSAIEIHEILLGLELEDREKLEVLYQLGILYEDLKHTQKALAFYQRIIDRISGMKHGGLSKHLQMIGDMAAWRIQQLNWLQDMEKELQQTGEDAQATG